jgi:hypothetical protein
MLSRVVDVSGLWIVDLAVLDSRRILHERATSSDGSRATVISRRTSIVTASLVNERIVAMEMVNNENSKYRF